MGMEWKDKGYVYIAKCTTPEGSSRISKATPSSQPLLKSYNMHMESIDKGERTA